MATDNRKILAGVGPASLAYFAPGDTAGPSVVAGTAGVQTVTVSGTPTGGTFTLTWNGQTTAPITYNAAAAAVQAALNALAGASTVTVSGAGPWVVTFPALLPQVVMTANGSALTGGSSPSVAVANTTPGVQTTNGATAAIPAAFKDAGLCSQSGLVANVAETVNKVKSYGSTQIQRVIIQDSERDFDVEFQETNPVTIAVYNRQPVGSITPDGSGAFSQQIGTPATQTYAAIFDVIDGSNHIRYYCPRVQVASAKSRTIAPGKEIMYGVSLTALPDVSGNAVYEYYVVNALAS